MNSPSTARSSDTDRRTTRLPLSSIFSNSIGLYERRSYPADPVQYLTSLSRALTHFLDVFSIFLIKNASIPIDSMVRVF